MAAANAKHLEVETLAKKNKEYFDNAAAQTVSWPQWVVDLHSQIAEFLLSPDNEAWLGLPSFNPVKRSSNTKMLDYACGDGFVSRALKAHFASCIGIDVSGGMLARYQEMATKLGLGPDEMKGACGDLLAEPLQQTDPPLSDDCLWEFDLVAVCAALHHIEDIDAAIRKLAERLKVGGTLLVIDVTPMDGSTPEQREHMEAHPQPHQYKPHPASHTVGHDGFSEKQMRELFENAGCAEVRWKFADRLSDVPPASTGKSQTFFARGTKL